MYVQLQIAGAVITFTPKTSEGTPYPYLLGVGALRVAARAGQRAGLGVGESPSLPFKLDNNERQSAPLVGNPLRSIATVFNDDGSVFFSGAISRVQFGRVIALTIAN